MKEISTNPICLRCGKYTKSLVVCSNLFYYCQCQGYELSGKFQMKNSLCSICDSPKIGGAFKKASFIIGVCSNPSCYSYSIIKSSQSKSAKSYDIFSYNTRHFLYNSNTKTSKIYLYRGKFTINFSFLKDFLIEVFKQKADFIK